VSDGWGTTTEQPVDGDSQDVGPVDEVQAAPADEFDDPLDGGPVGDLPEAPQTGDAGVDAAVADLVAVVGGPLDGQVAAYDRVHRALQDRLADVEG
jgi:hypothetical protein